MPVPIAPGTALNPTGKQQPPLERIKRAELKNALRSALHEQCTRPGKENLTWLQFIVSGLIEAAADRVPWATREVFNRAFGRIPIAVNVDAHLTAELTDRTPDELLARLDALRDEARLLRDNTAIDAEVADVGFVAPERRTFPDEALPAAPGSGPVSGASATVSDDEDHRRTTPVTPIDPTPAPASDTAPSKENT
jgi:hypothetical protein